VKYRSHHYIIESTSQCTLQQQHCDKECHIESRFFTVGDYSLPLTLNSFHSCNRNCILSRNLFTVSQLREHWEETSAKVMARRNQLEDLLVDNQQFDSKRREVEAWLTRMEAWLARMRPVGMTADVLEAQIREQKVSWAEAYLADFGAQAGGQKAYIIGI